MDVSSESEESLSSVSDTSSEEKAGDAVEEGEPPGEAPRQTPEQVSEQTEVTVGEGARIPVEQLSSTSVLDSSSNVAAVPNSELANLEDRHNIPWTMNNLQEDKAQTSNEQKKVEVQSQEEEQQEVEVPRPEKILAGAGVGAVPTSELSALDNKLVEIQSPEQIQAVEVQSLQEQLEIEVEKPVSVDTSSNPDDISTSELIPLEDKLVEVQSPEEKQDVKGQSLEEKQEVEVQSQEGNVNTSANGGGVPTSEPSALDDKDVSEAYDLQEVEVQSPKENVVPSSEATEAPKETEEEWTDILGNGQLMKKVVQKGAGISTRPTPQSRVKVRTRGHLDSGETVDKHTSRMFTVGDGDVIQAWDLAITLMEKGEIAKISTHSRFAYGSNGRSPDIPSNAKITYDLELLDVLEPLDFQTLSEEDLLAAVDKKRVRGNELFLRQEYERADNSYQRGLKMFKSFIEEQKVSESNHLQDMQVRLWNNVAAAQFKMGLNKAVLESCENVLKIAPDNVKALFRSGKVLSLTGETDQAVTNLQKALSLNPEEKAIKVELQRAIQKREQVKHKEKEMYKRMMEGKPATKKPPSKGAARQESSSWGPLPYLTVAAVVATVGIGLAYLITQRH